MKPGRKPREIVNVAVRAKTYERLAVAAQRKGEQAGILLDGILCQWLDRHGGEGN